MPNSASRARRVAGYQIVCDEQGVTRRAVPEGVEPPVEIAWDTIRLILAYKQDCYAIDQIRIILFSGGESANVDVTEDDAGGPGLLAELPRRLRGCPRLRIGGCAWRSRRLP